MPFFTDRENRFRILWCMIFGLFFSAAVTMICLWTEKFVWQTDYLTSVQLDKILNGTYELKTFFFHSLLNRFRYVVALILFAAAGMKRITEIVFWGWYGFSAGMAATILCVRYGIRGVLLFTASMFPQQFFFVLGFGMLLEICCRRKRKTGLITAVLLLVVGCLFEATVNPLILKAFLYILQV